ncbi:MAG TPA: hypothetical protein VL201_01360 [Patescibacteria group bacterium]|jgi:hypothetical protein|nr:hypothetical protein [Patescibacteria group bacterium]
MKILSLLVTVAVLSLCNKQISAMQQFNKNKGPATYKSNKFLKTSKNNTQQNEFDGLQKNKQAIWERRNESDKNNGQSTFFNNLQQQRKKTNLDSELITVMILTHLGNVGQER